ncbi:MAG: putative Na+/H+ antiporter [Holophagales bacterium]|nr:putative Na+/H+ antiporter [Holophagales bacterium]
MNRVAEHGSIPTTARHRLAGGLACCAALLLAAPALSAGAVPAAGAVLPLPLDAYTGEAGMSLWQLLVHRAGRDPVNLVATVVFLLAILHTFAAAPITAAAHRLRDRTARETRGDGHSFRVEILHFLGEVEAVFGIWAIPLLLTAVAMKGWPAVESYVANVHYTEPMFVVVVMAIASTRPILSLAEKFMGAVAGRGGGTPLAWWTAILTAGPLLGSFITEPAAMTICALLLARHLFELDPSSRLKYGTLGLLFVNVSVGGTLTHFAAPPVLMVAGKYGWGLTFMLRSFGWKAAVAILIATTAYAVFFRKEFALLAGTKKARLSDPVERPSERAVPTWIVLTHLLFLGWTVFTAHTPALFVAGFLYFLAFTQATAPHQNPLNLRPALLVGFFLAGLVLHGTLQQWWIAPVLARLDEIPLFFGATVLTAFNDNAAITYLASLVPGFTPELKYAVVAGAVTGGGLTVIANAPNPAGQSILSRYFPDGVRPIGLLLGALVPTAVVALAFLLLP